MKSRFTLKCLAVIAGFSVSAGALLAQDSGPLIDLLVKKGVVSDQEAEVLRVELQKDFAVNSSAGKLNLSSSLSEFKNVTNSSIRTWRKSPMFMNLMNSTRLRCRYLSMRSTTTSATRRALAFCL